MMDQLQVFSVEVSRVAREVGTEGILGGQAQISGVDGIWKELTMNGTFSCMFHTYLGFQVTWNLRHNIEPEIINVFSANTI